MASNLMIPHLFSFLLIVLFDFLWLQFREKSSQLKENALFNVSHMKNIFDFLKAKDIWKLTDKMKKRRAEENFKQLQRKSIESQSPFELKKKIRFRSNAFERVCIRVQRKGTEIDFWKHSVLFYHYFINNGDHHCCSRPNQTISFHSNSFPNHGHLYTSSKPELFAE